MNTSVMAAKKYCKYSICWMKILVCALVVGLRKLKKALTHRWLFLSKERGAGRSVSWWKSIYKSQESLWKKKRQKLIRRDDILKGIYGLYKNDCG